MSGVCLSERDASSLRFRPLEERDLTNISDICEEQGWLITKQELHSCFSTLKDGYLILENNGEFVGVFNYVKMNERYCFVGIYAVVKPLRYQGFGKMIWKEGLRRIGDMEVILGAAPYNFDLYERKGFRPSKDVSAVKFKNAKFDLTGDVDTTCMVEKITGSNIEYVTSYDEENTGIQRKIYLRYLLLSDGVHGLVAKQHGKIVGFVMASLYRDEMFLISFFQADSMTIARMLTRNLAASCPGDASFCIHIPGNREEIFGLFANKEELSLRTYYYITTGVDNFPRVPEKIFCIGNPSIHRN